MLSDSISSLPALETEWHALGIDERPTLGERAVSGLREETPGLHGSLAIEQSPDDLWAWARALARQEDEALLCGLTGYGIQSRFWILYWRRGPLVLLARVAFGALEDARWAARSASGSIGLANELVRLAEHQVTAGCWPAGRLMLVVSDERDGQGWCWLNPDSLPLAGRVRLDTRLGLLGAFEAIRLLSGSPQPSGGDGAGRPGEGPDASNLSNE
jgi:hypothetical protein